nr:hypothetical protein [Helicobacter pylori]
MFFNLLCSSHLKPNSIVIIDEGFSKLSAPTCIECHNFLKKLGQDKGITFVISTHNLYFANLDYLDELKFLKVNKDLRSVSVNQFTSRDLNDSTPSKVIKKLICANHKTLNENDRLLFVEGISDYNFKNFKNIEDCFSQKDKIKLDLKNKSFRSHTAYTNALKNDLLLHPNLVEAERKFLQAFGIALS